MATFHFEIKSGKRGSANNHSLYIARLGKYRRIHSDLVAAGAGNLPAWTQEDVGFFWRCADRFERLNGSAYREIVVALPIELDGHAREQLLLDFIESAIPGKPYQYAIHCPQGSLSQIDQPHAHVMFSDRANDSIERTPEQHFRRYNPYRPEEGGARKMSGGRLPQELRNELVALRRCWAQLHNETLASHGYDAFIDHRSYQDRGISQSAERHLGAYAIQQLDRQRREQWLLARAVHSRLYPSSS